MHFFWFGFVSVIFICYFGLFTFIFIWCEFSYF